MIMKAMVCTKYGSPEVFELRDVEKPIPKYNEVLIRISAAPVTTADCNTRMGKPFIARFVTGLIKPKKIFGFELAGEIESTGKNVKRFKEGDQIYGGTTLRLGAYAEYLCLPEDGPIALKPKNMTYLEAAAIVEGGLSALPFLTYYTEIQEGQNVLIIGASGSIGTAATQLAKYFGAIVTGVCSTKNIELVKSLGADNVIDYTKEDFTKIGQLYDIIIAIAGKSTFSECKRLLKKGGVYITDKPSMGIIPHILKMTCKRAIIALAGIRPAAKKVNDLNFLKELIESGKLKSIIDRCYPLAETVEAHRYVGKGVKKGNVVLTMDKD